MLELKNISFSAQDDGGEKEILKNISVKLDKVSNKMNRKVLLIGIYEINFF